MLSCVPAGSSFVHALFNCGTLRRLTNSSGLYRCASYVRLYISQSSGAGRSSISVETPGTLFSAAPSFFCALAATARVARTPISRTVFFMRALETPSAFEIVCRLAFGLTQNQTCHFAGGVHNEFDVRTRRL